MPALATLAAVRAAIPRLASVADAEINRLIDEASDAIESYCNRTFGSASHTEVHDQDGTGQLFLRQRPIISVESITVDFLSDSPIVLTADQYDFDARTGEVRSSTGNYAYFPGDSSFSWAWPYCSGWQSCRVIYTAGYATIPASIVGLCLKMVGRGASSLATDAGVKSKTWGKVSVTYGDVASASILASDDMRILAPYRIYSL